ncbi:FAD-binding oxidoreductase [Ascoidea rubescens DSM 1968]|uniref:D-lactate dehydrogenase (cytochrome) n=1 Tax=Ascoidea rubescens DSM 1968 TaxID=1344418 RepID=A0A1D2VF61_9ASCO|nr:D-lactate dehydrogenase [Ascoidea rubescens DSM 1968]ODV60249.1 D-lactate dehydrogenase [Ascoidea rubescens DSM 1968]
MASGDNYNNLNCKSTLNLFDLNSPVYCSNHKLPEALQKIADIVGIENVTNSENEIQSHRDSLGNSFKPLKNEYSNLIVYPTSTEQISKVVRVCNEYRLPIVPYAGGTSLEGQYVPTRNGICLDTSKMAKIIRLNQDDLDIVVQPGVTWQDLNAFLQPYNLFFGPDPGPGAQIGGMVATSCSGTNAFRYGTMKDNVLSMKIVLPDGTLIKTKNRPRKSSAGYNLTNLFIGSEGTLGICTEVTLKLNIIPKHEIIALSYFDSIKDASKTVSDLFKNGIQLNAIELMDSRQMKVINQFSYTDRKWSENNLLICKIGGPTKNILNDTIDIFEKISSQNNGFNFEIATNEREKTELWSARKTNLWSSIDWAKSMDPDMKYWTTDVAVPVSKLPNVIEETAIDIENSGLNTTIVGHVGDGNYHALIIFPPEKEQIAKQVLNRMIKRAIDNEGTVSGEHGIGLSKRDFLIDELGQDTINTMRKIKLALDPLRIMNPDKIFKIDPNDVKTSH